MTESLHFTVPVSPIHIVFELALGGSGVTWVGVPRASRLWSCKSYTEKISVDRVPTARLGYNGENYARVVNFYLFAGLVCESSCFGVPVALPFLQTLLLCTHDLFLAETPRD